MFTNPVYNLSPQYNENLLTQNLAGLQLNSGQQDQQQQQQRQNFEFGTFQFPQASIQLPVDVSGYAPPTLDGGDMKWPSPDDVNATYQRGSTVVRQYNNSTIDDYYKKFIRPITDYVAIPTTGQLTYVYQNLGGQQALTATGLNHQSVGGNDVPTDPNSAVPVDGSHSNTVGLKKKNIRKNIKNDLQNMVMVKVADILRVKKQLMNDTMKQRTMLIINNNHH